MQPNRRRFLLYWLGLWAVLTPLVIMSVSPPPHSREAFLNPALWGAMLSVSGLLAWGISRYEMQLKGFAVHPVTLRFLTACILANQSAILWRAGIRNGNRFLEILATFSSLFALLVFAKSVEGVCKRLRARHNQCCSQSTTATL